jgi:hypothetical protein
MKKTVIVMPVMIASLLVIGSWVLATTGVRGMSSKRSTLREMHALQLGLSLYAQEYGGVPDETSNTRILELLTYGNPRKLSFYSAPSHLVRDGLLLDDWEHPFVFQKTTDNMVILSAGKDGIYYTKDDLTLSALVH